MATTAKITTAKINMLPSSDKSMTDRLILSDRYRGGYKSGGSSGIGIFTQYFRTTNMIYMKK